LILVNAPRRLAVDRRSQISESAMSTPALHVGYHELNPDISLNFQLNRWLGYDAETLLADMRDVAPRLTTYSAWIAAFLELAERALADGRRLDAAYHTRCAEFFMSPTDPRRRGCRERFIGLMREGFGVTAAQAIQVPYAGVALPGYRFTAPQPRDTIVLFGGFDSYIEEFIPILLVLRDAGFDVVAFEGPGQGSVIEDLGVPMTPDWHLPVAAVLDHLQLSNVTLLGISLGGCLVVRAAAYEPRVARVVAFDILTDFLECLLRQTPGAVRLLVRGLLRAGAGSVLDAAIAAAARRQPVVEWGMTQAMHVFGVKTPHAALAAAAQYRTGDVSARLTQDVLLCAGAEDHYVPLHQLYDQARWLTGARSVTTRVFTRADQAQNHCQIGNLPLALRTIGAWIDLTVANE
jgi:alpha-beta hydrolase superfamily lysophospholipase